MTNRKLAGDGRRMLFVINNMLGPIIGGGRQRCWEIIKRAGQRWGVDVVIIAPPRDVERDRDQLVDVPNGRVFMFADEVGRRPDLIRRSHEARTTIERLNREVGGYEKIHAECFYVLPSLPDELLTRTVLAEQNIESTLVEQAEQLSSAGLSDGGGHAEGATSAHVRRAEEKYWNLVKSVVTLCPEDHQQLIDRRPDLSTVLIPNGWDHLPAPKQSCESRTGVITDPSLLFYGDYDYGPNVDAIMWLVKEIMPLILANMPDARLRLGGVNAPGNLVSLVSSCPGVEWIGYIRDLPTELNRADMMLCPIRIGGGVRVKVTEAIHQGRLLVSTTAGGVDWIPPSVRSAVTFADSPKEFANSVAGLASDPVNRKRRYTALDLGRADLPTWDAGFSRLMDIWNSSGRHDSGDRY